MSSAKEYFGTDFVKKIYEMFEKAEQEGKFVFMHGTYSLDDAINIALNGLECDYPELLYTAELMNKNEKSIIQNPKYDPLKNIEATVEDRSFETKTGKFIEISLPPSELEFYEEASKYEERE